MMGRLSHAQGQLLYSVCLEEVAPDEHLGFIENRPDPTPEPPLSSTVNRLMKNSNPDYCTSLARRRANS
jgi:hypothetical protein